MEDYQSKYTGEQVEELLDMVANGEAGGGGGIAVETDPIFSASPAASITDAKKAEWDGKQDAIADLATIREGASKGATALQSVPSEYGTKAWVTEQARDIANDAVGDFEAIVVEPLAEEVSQLKGAIGNKVDKVTGKGLSAEDFTSEFKSKLEALSNYDDTELSNAISTLRGDFNKLVSGDTTTAIKTFNEVIAFLDGITDSEDLAGIIASIEQQIAGKMDNVTLAKVATSGSYNDLSNKPTIPSAVTESTVSGWGFTKNTGTYSKPTGGIPKNDLSSAVQASLDKADAAVPVEILYDSVYAHANGITDDQYAYALPSSVNGDEDDIIATRNSLKTINGESLVGSGDITISGGATLTEADIAAMGFTKNTGTYSKPDNGIPKSDLASAVQTSLGKADTALQSYTEQYKGTITGVSANGTSVATSGVANIPAASTSKYGVTKLSSATNSTSTTLAATASAVKSAYDLANGKQDKLVSGTNIKTINGTSILGSGNITISGGGGGGGTNNYPLVKVTSYWLPYGGIQPNTYYQMTTAPQGGLEIVLATPTDTSIVNEYIVEFPVVDVGNFMLIMPDDIVWVNDEVLAPTKGGTYTISVVNKIACYAYTSSTPNVAGGGSSEWE